jgi:trans-aconitate methyltransferase
MPDNWSSGDAYESYVGRWSRRIGHDFLAWLLPSPSARWLDLGCGTGALTAQVLRDCSPSSIIAVDPSEEFLEVARRENEDERVSFQRGEGGRIPLPDASVDVTVSGFALNFMPDQPAAMAEQVRVTAPNGLVAAYVWDYGGHAQFIRFFWDAAVALDPAARSLHEGERFPACHPEPLRTLFESARLTAVQVEPVDIPTRFDTFEDYWQPFLSGVGPAPAYCMSLDETAREALRSRLQKMLPADPDGRILLAARAWAVRGTRTTPST